MKEQNRRYDLDLELELGNALAKVTSELIGERFLGRTEWLGQLATAISLSQIEVMQQYRRGWLKVMVETDNYARRGMGLPQYEIGTSPVTAYIDLAHGNDVRFKILVARLSMLFGESKSQIFSSEVLSRCIPISENRYTRYVPPELFTYSTLRLDNY